MKASTFMVVSLLAGVVACRNPGAETADTSDESVKQANHAPAERVDFAANAKTSAAFIHRYAFSVYLVADPDTVIVASFPQPSSENARMECTIKDDAKCGVTRITGPGVVKLVMPSGATPRFPEGSEYHRVNAVGGIIRCSFINQPQDATLLTVALDQVDFGDGKRYWVRDTSLKASPPPP